MKNLCLDCHNLRPVSVVNHHHNYICVTRGLQGQRMVFGAKDEVRTRSDCICRIFLLLGGIHKLFEGYLVSYIKPKTHYRSHSHSHPFDFNNSSIQVLII